MPADFQQQMVSQSGGSMFFPANSHLNKATNATAPPPNPKKHEGTTELQNYSHLTTISLCIEMCYG